MGKGLYAFAMIGIYRLEQSSGGLGFADSDEENEFGVTTE